MDSYYQEYDVIKGKQNELKNLSITVIKILKKLKKDKDNEMKKIKKRP